MSKRIEDYYDGFADQDYENDVEAAFQKHLEDHQDDPDPMCEWCKDSSY